MRRFRKSTVKEILIVSHTATVERSWQNPRPFISLLSLKTNGGEVQSELEVGPIARLASLPARPPQPYGEYKIAGISIFFRRIDSDSTAYLSQVAYPYSPVPLTLTSSNHCSMQAIRIEGENRLPLPCIRCTVWSYNAKRTLESREWPVRLMPNLVLNMVFKKLACACASEHQ